nr:uncharacterized protein LOC105093297 [Camelus dromedarius]
MVKDTRVTEVLEIVPSPVEKDALEFDTPFEKEEVNIPKMCLAEYLSWHYGNPPPCPYWHWKGRSEGSKTPAWPSLNQRISRRPVPAGTARRARTDARSYPFSPRRAPSRCPGGGIHARPGGRGPPGPASGAEGTRRRRGCALRLREPGLARSFRASPGRTRGAFAARALGSGRRPLGLCSRPGAAAAANRVGRRAGTKRPAPEMQTTENRSANRRCTSEQPLPEKIPLVATACLRQLTKHCPKLQAKTYLQPQALPDFSSDLGRLI